VDEHPWAVFAKIFQHYADIRYGMYGDFVPGELCKQYLKEHPHPLNTATKFSEVDTQPLFFFQ
jgi:hypothetical protein